MLYAYANINPNSRQPYSDLWASGSRQHSIPFNFEQYQIQQQQLRGYQQQQQQLQHELSHLQRQLQFEQQLQHQHLQMASSHHASGGLSAMQSGPPPWVSAQVAQAQAAAIQQQPRDARFALMERPDGVYELA